MKREDLTQGMLKHLLHYNPSTGEFTWLNPLGRVPAGSKAGSTRKDGYVVIKIHNVPFKAHRLAYLYMTGAWPISGDHEDRNPGNNRWKNIRPSTHAQNCRNRVFQNATGFQCVGRESSGRFRARVKLDGVRKYLGTFDTAEEAARVVAAAKVVMHGEFAVAN